MYLLYVFIVVPIIHFIIIIIIIIREYGSTLYIGIAMVFCGTFGHM